MREWVDRAVVALERLRRTQPLIHLITNTVTPADVANSLLALGARPIMARAREEVAEIAGASRALALNLGTPSRGRLEAMKLAAAAADAAGIPIVFDPVGVGASSFRRSAAGELLESVHMQVIRGNAGEMGALAGIAGTQSGVDTASADYDRAKVAMSLARQFRAVAVIAGGQDYVSDGARILAVENTCPLLQRITGAGDMQSAILAAAAAVEPDALAAALSGLLWFGVAAQRAARADVVRGPGSFRTELFDQLAALGAEEIRIESKIMLLGRSNGHP